MKRLVTLAALAIVVLACDDSQAANRRVRNNQVPAVTRNRVSDGQGNGPLGRLMELERRKNAALRQMFLGR
jgi:hypothetical protein